MGKANGTNRGFMREWLAFLSDPEWIKSARARMPLENVDIPQGKGLPSGITYLSQLLGHDMFLTEPKHKVYVSGAFGGPEQSDVNMIVSKLMLSTIYGRTAVADSLLYRSDDPNLFDLFEYERYGKEYCVLKFVRDPRHSWSYPVVADSRNFTTPMLARITQAFMEYHNSVVRRLYADGFGVGSKRLQAFALARGVAIRTWHNIIEREIIEEVCIPEEDYPESLTKVSPKKWQNLAELFNNSTLLAKDIFRSFHALPNEHYAFNKESPKKGISLSLSREIAGPELTSSNVPGRLGRLQKKQIRDWLTKWDVDFSFFFDQPDQDGTLLKARNRTGFTPSFAFSRKVDGDTAPIQVHDHRRTEAAEIKKRLKELKIEPDLSEFARDINGQANTPGDVEALDVPLAIGMLAEAQYSHKNANNIGKLGPLGSRAVRHQLMTALDAARVELKKFSEVSGLSAALPDPEDLPKTFMEMVKTSQNS